MGAPSSGNMLHGTLQALRRIQMLLTWIVGDLRTTTPNGLVDREQSKMPLRLGSTVHT